MVFSMNVTHLNPPSALKHTILIKAIFGVTAIRHLIINLQKVFFFKAWIGSGNNKGQSFKYRKWGNIGDIILLRDFQPQ